MRKIENNDRFYKVCLRRMLRVNLAKNKVRAGRGMGEDEMMCDIEIQADWMQQVHNLNTWDIYNLFYNLKYPKIKFVIYIIISRFPK